MGGSFQYEVIRDPLWDNIPLEPMASGLLDTPVVQRLRYIRQLGHAFLVYPGATHSRFEHALGAYHLSRLALTSLQERGELDGITEFDRQAVKTAALLHDIGHYPFSHGLEEAGFPSHEVLGEQKLQSLAMLMESSQGGCSLVTEVGALIRGRSGSVLQGLISGSLDLDKIDYLSRDARMCGVPYGAVDVDRLLASLVLVESPDGNREVGIVEKGLSALESLLFAKYQMYRNVYWHHAVRSATCMFKRAVRTAARLGVLTNAELEIATDGGLMTRLIASAPNGLAAAVQSRRLFKRTLDLPASEIAPDEGWTDANPDLLEQVEDRVALEVGLQPGELLIDYPARKEMLSVNLPIRLKNGRVDRLTDHGKPGHLGLPQVAGQLYRSARRLRVFTARPASGKVAGITSLVTLPAEEVAARCGSGGSLLD